MTTETTNEKLFESLLSRRKMMKRTGFGVMGATALGAAATGGLSLLSQPAEAAAPSLLTDKNILNFALNLEYLEAEYYYRAAFGVGLSADLITGTGKVGPVLGGTKVPFATPAFYQYAAEIATDERNHVKFLRSTLGAAAVARPEIDLMGSFTQLAVAAGIISPGQTFNPFADENSFLLGAFVFEDVGVTAYHGAVPFIKNKAYLSAAAGILAVEAYHASEIRLLLLQLGLVDPVQKISNLRDALDGPTDDDQGILLYGVSNIVPTDANSLAFARTPGQVLSIVYGGGETNGLFFPAGVNGPINTAD